jgi:flagellar hook-associated protein 1 FlgK
VSLSSSLFTAINAMGVDQGALAVTSNNIANVNTPGYSREVANLEEAGTVTYGNLIIGTGVEMAGITGVRDNVINLRLNQEAQTQGKLNTFVNGMNQVQTVFNETAGNGLQSLISNFFGAWQTLSTDPTNAGDRQAVIADAQNLATGFHQSAQALQTQSASANQGVTDTVSDINSLSSQIAQLNQQTYSASNGGATPNTLIDQRNQLINQLSAQVDLQIIPSDQNSVTITTGGGALLVSGQQSFTLSTSNDPATGNQDVYSQGQDITSTITSGNLAGYLQMRDTEIPALSSQLDTLAAGIVNSVNTQSTAGFDANGAAGVNFFSALTATAGAATNISVAITNPSQVAASSDGTPGDNGNAKAIAALANQNIVGGETPISYYGGLVAKVGNDTASAQSSLSGEQLLIQQLQDQQASVSGVSLNEEGANLQLYQNAYNAAARVASVVQGLFQTAINMGLVTTT